MLDTTIILHLIIMFMYLTILSAYTATHMWPHKLEEGTAYMPTLPDYPGVSWIQHQTPGLPYGSPYLQDKIIF